MRAPALLAAALWLAACGDRPTSAPDAAVAAPRLDPLPETSVMLTTTLTGSAAPGTTVRLYVAEACAGPVLRELTPEALAAGVEVDLVPGVDNVFAAEAVDSRGSRSPCSEAVRTYLVPPVRPMTPVVFSVRPRSPSRETRFYLGGLATPGSTVRAWRSTCGTGLMGQGPAEVFQDGGLAVDLSPNADVQLVLDARSVSGLVSQCSGLTSLQNDLTPPVLYPELRSPTPAPEPEAYVALNGRYSTSDVAFAQVFEGASCSGTPLAQCDGGACHPLVVPFPSSVSTSWSVVAEDRVGNVSACIPGDRAYVNDPGLPPSVVSVWVERGTPGALAQVRGLVPVDRLFVELHEDATCTRAFALMNASDFAAWGRFASLDGGAVVTARALFPDGGQDACSAPALVPP